MSKVLNLDQVQFDSEGANSYTVETNFTPGPTGDQIDAAVVTAQYTEVVGTVNFQAIKLPANMRPGATFIIRNQGPTTIRLYPPSGYEFNNFPTDKFLILEPYQSGTFREGEIIVCRYLGGTQIMVSHEILIRNAAGVQEVQVGRSGAVRVTQDFSIGGRYIAYGYSQYVAVEVTANAGGGQTNATLLGPSTSIVQASGTPADNDSVRFRDDVGLGGTPHFVYNNTGLLLDVYPKSGGRINSLAIDSPFTMSANQRTFFLSLDGKDWKTFGSDTT